MAVASLAGHRRDPIDQTGLFQASFGDGVIAGPAKATQGEPCLPFAVIAVQRQHGTPVTYARIDVEV